MTGTTTCPRCGQTLDARFACCSCVEPNEVPVYPEQSLTAEDDAILSRLGVDRFQMRVDATADSIATANWFEGHVRTPEQAARRSLMSALKVLLENAWQSGASTVCVPRPDFEALLRQYRALGGMTVYDKETSL